MIHIDQVTFSYPHKDSTLSGIDLDIKQGECVLLCGESGCGKTTVTKLINGLIPHFISEHKLSGSVTVNQLEVANTKMYELSKIIGSVFQNPKSQFFNLDTNSELVFGLENDGTEPSKIKNRLECTIHELQIKGLLDRNIFSLSGGEKQLLAFASVYAMNPDVFILDEPSANLDENTIEILQEQLLKAKERGHTIVIAEHRIYYLMDLIDRAVFLKNGKILGIYTKNEFRALKESERLALDLRSLSHTNISIPSVFDRVEQTSDLQIKNFAFYYKNKKVFDSINFSIKFGDVIGIIGYNGSGKTTFCRGLCGLLKNIKGQILFAKKKLSQKECRKLCALVMQDVNHQLFSDTVWNECELSLQNIPKERIESVLKAFDLFKWKESHPMALSGGQKQRLAIATAILSKKKVLVFDEPTSGLDYHHMIEVSTMIHSLSKEGHIVLIATHDMEFLNLTCNYHIML